ncbi:MAG TPA: ISL3 family transposase [Pirellulales bacterium]|nr:ISL3 family transposase [Pirellulales bacterium]
MNVEELTALLGGWEGYLLGTASRLEPVADEGRSEEEVWLELRPCADRRKCCSGCGQEVDQVHDVEERWVRDLPILGTTTWLCVHRCRLACPRCGPKLEELSWLPRYSRVTKRLADSVAQLCAVLPIKHVAAYFGLHWDTVKAIDKAHLQSALGPVDLSNVEVIAMDEFAIQKGHRYATVIVEPYTKRVLWIGRGRGREEIRPFFELLGQDRRQRIKAVVMDMNGAYEQEVMDQCPRAEIVFDLFHVVAKFGREVIDRVRLDEANRLRHDKPRRAVIKHSRWLLLRNRENIRQREDRVRLDELLAANRRLFTVYVMKDDLKHLWAYRYQGAALRFWKGWYNRAIRSRIAPLKKFARNLHNYLYGILGHCHWPLHTSLLEGINNKIKVIKRMAYGFRDDDYFFLKIRAAFPGTPC